MGAMNPFNEQNYYRIRDDATAADPGTPNWITTENQATAEVIDVDTNFRIRFVVSNSGSANSTSDFQLFVDKNSTSYAAVTTSSSNVQAVDAGSSADATVLTTANFQLTAGTGSAANGEYSEDGIAGTNLANGDYFELEFGVSIVGADVADGDTLDFRVYYGTSAMDQYDANATPRVEANKVSVATGDGAASGTGTATATGAATADSDGSASGTGTATATGAATAASDGSAAGTGGASAVGEAVAPGDGSAAGTGAATGVGQATKPADGAATGTGAATATGASTAAADGSAAGTGTATATGASTAASDGAAAGTGTATGVAAEAGSVGAAAGTGTATGVGASTAAADGTATGTGTASGVGDSSEEAAEALPRGGGGGGQVWIRIDRDERKPVRLNARAAVVRVAVDAATVKSGPWPVAISSYAAVLQVRVESTNIGRDDTAEVIDIVRRIEAMQKTSKPVPQNLGDVQKLIEALDGKRRAS